jgi:hypothetical protein
MVNRWRMVALLLDPSPARASTPTVSAPLSSGSVVAPLHMVPHADDAVASLGSVSPARRRVQPARRRCSGGEVGHPPAGRSRVFFSTRFASIFTISSPNRSRSMVRVA